MHTVAAWNRLRSGPGLCDYMHEKWLICSVVDGTVWEPILWRFWAKKAQWLRKKSSNKNSLQQHTWVGSLLLDFTGWNILYFQQQDLKLTVFRGVTLCHILRWWLFFFPTKNQQPASGLQARKSLVQQHHAVLTRGNFVPHPLGAALESLLLLQFHIVAINRSWPRSFHVKWKSAGQQKNKKKKKK